MSRSSGDGTEDSTDPTAGTPPVAAPEEAAPPGGAAPAAPPPPPRWHGPVVVTLSGLVGLGVALSVFRDLLVRGDEVVLGPYSLGYPGDLNGTLWFYQWVAHAVHEGLPLHTTDMVCAPTGVNLGSRFANPVDALLAVPLLAEAGLPKGYNLFALGIPALGTLGAAFFFWALTRAWAPTVALSLFFGFNAYSFAELGGGRPTTALVWLIPLLFGAWWRALFPHTRGAGLAWAGATGAVAALMAWAYVPFAFMSAPFALALAAAAALRPEAGRARAWPLAALLVAGLVALPLLGEVAWDLLVARTMFSSQTAAPGVRDIPAAPWPWEPRLWSDLRGSLGVGPGSGIQVDPASLLQGMESYASPLGTVFAAPPPEPLSAWRIPTALWVLLPLAALAGRGRGWVWLVAAVIAWSGTLGPRLLASVHPAVPMPVGGEPLWLPLGHLVNLFPPLAFYLRPVRFYPFELFFLLAAMAVAFRAGREWLASKRSWARFVVDLGLVVAAGAWLQEVANGDAALIRRVPWVTPAGLTRLRDTPEAGAIIEIPPGLGHGVGPLQAIHGRARSGALNGSIEMESDCPTPDWLWRLGRFGFDEETTLEPNDLGWAWAAGFRWVVLYKLPYSRNFSEHLAGLGTVRGRLEALYGPALEEDDYVAVYALPEPASLPAEPPPTEPYAPPGVGPRVPTATPAPSGPMGPPPGPDGQVQGRPGAGPALPPPAPPGPAGAPGADRDGEVSR